MSWSLKLHNGDLNTFGAEFGVVTNETKLTQDLRCHILEHMGTDWTHPEFGSVLDGGTTPDGIEVPGIIGEEQFDFVVLAIEGELRRIVREHQGKQLTRAKADQYVYAKSTLSPREVLLAVPNIEITQAEDSVLVKVTLLTASNGIIDVDIQLPT